MNLELMAMSFLRFEKHCPVALFQRSPRPGLGCPDVLGITRARYVLEIEIKRSLSDFKANEKKHHMKYRHSPLLHWNPLSLPPRWPKQFWFLVPCELVKKIEPHLPPWAGLMRGPGKNEIQQVRVVSPAPSNNESTRLTAKEMIALGNCMANQIWTQASAIDRYLNRMDDDPPWDWYPKI